MTDLDDAATRLEAFLVRLDRLSLEDLRLVALPLPDRSARTAVLSEVSGAALEAGRTELVETARVRARTAITIAYDRHVYDPTIVGLNWGRSLGTTTDRLALTLAAEDAAVAAVMSDVLDEELIDALTEGFERAAGLPGATTTPSLSLDRPGAIGLVGRIVFGVMLVVVGLAIGFAEAALGLIAAAIAGRRRSRS